MAIAAITAVGWLQFVKQQCAKRREEEIEHCDGEDQTCTKEPDAPSAGSSLKKSMSLFPSTFFSCLPSVDRLDRTGVQRGDKYRNQIK